MPPPWSEREHLYKGGDGFCQQRNLERRGACRAGCRYSTLPAFPHVVDVIRRSAIIKCDYPMPHDKHVQVFEQFYSSITAVLSSLLPPRVVASMLAFMRGCASHAKGQFCPALQWFLQVRKPPCTHSCATLLCYEDMQ